eukprot:15482-Heterococcus_DN1.PRE.2
MLWSTSTNSPQHNSSKNLCTDVQCVYNATGAECIVNALRQLLNRFVYKAVRGRDVIHDMIEQIFPLLQQIMATPMTNTSEEASTASY